MLEPPLSSAETSAAVIVSNKTPSRLAHISGKAALNVGKGNSNSHG
jgi:hypothetical protein